MRTFTRSNFARRGQNKYFSCKISKLCSVLRHIQPKWVLLGFALLFIPLVAQATESEPIPSEADWLRDHAPKLKLCFNPDFPPLEFVNENGEFVGMGADFMALLESRLGVRFPRQVFPDWNQHLAALKSGECALAPTIVRTPPREEYTQFTTPYATVPVVIITARHFHEGETITLKDLRGKRVAVVSGYATESYLQKHVAMGYEIVPMPDVARGLRAVSFGQVDAFVGNLAVAAYYISQEGIPNLRVAGNTDYQFSFSIGVSQQYPELFQALSRELAKIPPQQMEDIRNQWIRLKIRYGLSPKTLLILNLVAIFSVLLILGLAVMSYVLKGRLKEKITILEEARRTVMDQSELLRLTTEATQAGIWDFRPKTGTIHLNRQWFQMRGQNRSDQAISLDEYKRYVHPEDLPMVEEVFLNYTSAGGKYQNTMEFRALKDDGTSEWILSTGKIVEWDGNGTPTRVIGLDLDIQIIRSAQAGEQRSEEKFRAIFDYAPYAITITDMETGLYLDANRAFLESRGIDHANLHTMSPKDHSLLSDEEIQTVVDNLTRHGFIRNLESKVQNIDGTPMDMLFSSVILELEGKKQALSIMVDITNLKRTEEKLQESEARFRALFENAPIPLMNSSIKGQNIQFNEMFVKLSGYTVEDIPDQDRWWNLAYPDPEYRKQVISQWQDSLNRAADPEAAVIPNEYYITCKDGTQRTLSMDVNLIGDNLLVSFFDVTERNEKEAALRESMELLRATFHATTDGVLAVDKKMRVIQANQQFYDMWYIPPELRETNDDRVLREFVTDQLEDPDEFTSNIDKLYKSQSQEQKELTFKDGRVFERTSAPILMDEKEIGRVWNFRDITERKAIERTIDFERRQLLSIFDSLDEIIYVSDPHTYEMIFMNRRLRDLTGKDVLGEKCYKALQGLDSPCPFCTNSIILANGGEPYRWDHHNPLTHTDVAIVDQIVRWPDGRDVRLEFAMDVTERKRVEKALKKSEEKLRSIFSAMEDVIFVIDRDGRYIEIAPTQTALLYRPTGELLGKTLEDVFPPETATEFLRALRNALDRQKSVSLDYCLTIENREVWFSAVISPLLDNQAIWVARDITDRKTGEERLRLSEKKFSEIFTMTPDIVAITRLDDGKILDVNLGFEEITGWKRDEVLGRTTSEIRFWCEIKDRARLVKNLSSRDGVVQREVDFRLKNGEIRTGVYSARGIRISGENALIFVLQDVTERRRMEHDRRRLEQQLLQSQKLEAIGTLAGGVAHEINNPIGIIINYAQLIRDDVEQTTQVHDDATMIVEEGGRIAKIVRDLLSFSRQEKETHSPAFLEDVVHSTMSLVGKLLSKANIEVTLNLESGLPKVKCRTQQLMQVLMNLLTNARDELEDAYPGTDERKTIEIVLTRFTKDETPWQRIVVIDGGRGVQEAVRNRIFDPFFTTKTKDKGTGLGLSISHGIVGDHHGELWVENRKDGGAAFYIDIPEDNGWNPPKTI